MRLNLTVEGETEQNFAMNVLAPYLTSCGVHICKPRCTSLGKKKGVTHRGGLDTYQAFKNDIDRWIKQDRGADVRFSTMIDLYALPSSFPRFEESKNISDVKQRILFLENALKLDFNDNRFIPYIQLHEYEALLLADPNALLQWYPRERKAVNTLIEMCKMYKSPEEINTLNPPSKRIIQEIRDYKGAKTTAGLVVAKYIGLQKLRANCPHFNDWITGLENLGKGLSIS
jgi:hypothetical protein